MGDLQPYRCQSAPSTPRGSCKQSTVAQLQLEIELLKLELHRKHRHIMEMANLSLAEQSPPPSCSPKVRTLKKLRAASNSSAILDHTLSPHLQRPYTPEAPIPKTLRSPAARTCASDQSMTPPSPPEMPLRRNYGSMPRFWELKQAYHDALQTKAASEDPTQKWLRSVWKSSSAVVTDAAEIESTVEGLQFVFQQNHVPLPLKRTGPATYRLGERQRLLARLVNGRLMVRSGPTYVEFFEWLERQALPPM
jgi:hypothetical protein